MMRVANDISTVIGLYSLDLPGRSAEDIDIGQVGCSSRVNGLIAMNRLMGTETFAGIRRETEDILLPHLPAG